MSLPSTEISPDVRALAEAFKATPIGETIGYSDLSRAIGRDIQACRYLAASAMRAANREAGAIFANVKREGYKRLHPSEAHTIGHTTRRMIRARSARAIRTINTAISMANDVPDAARLRATAEASALGLIQHIARDSSVPIPESADKPVPVAMVARQFLERIGAKE